MRSITPAALALGLLLAIACGGGGNSDDVSDPYTGVWKGEQQASDLQTLSAPLCLLVPPATPSERGRFSGVLYLSGELLSLAVGEHLPDGTFTIDSQVNRYTGTLADQEASGTWVAVAGPAPGDGTWTLEHTSDDSCQD